MSMLQNVLVLLFVIFKCLSNCSVTLAAPVNIAEPSKITDDIAEPSWALLLFHVRGRQVDKDLYTMMVAQLSDGKISTDSLTINVSKKYDDDLKKDDDHLKKDYDDLKKDDDDLKTRVKRQGSGNKYADASQVSQGKMLRLYLQMLKNFVAGKSIGGSHPMHPNVVKPTIKMFKRRIVSVLFPEVGESAELVKN